MRNIEELLMTVRAIHPELRVCQIMSIAAKKAGWKNYDLFYIPDEMLGDGLMQIIKDDYSPCEIMPSDEPYIRASEVKAMGYDIAKALEDRKLFVHNLGVLLKQTRESIISAELDDHDIVTVTFKNGATNTINVNMDSYMAIVRDVTKHL